MPGDISLAVIQCYARMHPLRDDKPAAGVVTPAQIATSKTSLVRQPDAVNPRPRNQKKVFGDAAYREAMKAIAEFRRLGDCDHD